MARNSTNNKTTQNRGAGGAEDDTNVFYEDFMKVSAMQRCRSKSLDQLHTLNLSEDIFTRDRKPTTYAPIDDTSSPRNQLRMDKSITSE